MDLNKSSYGPLLFIIRGAKGQNFISFLKFISSFHSSATLLLYVFFIFNPFKNHLRVIFLLYWSSLSHGLRL